MSRFPKYRPTDDQKRQVMVMAGFGFRIKDICAVMQIDDQTLHTHYKHELATAEAEANVRVVQALYNNAVKHNNVTAQIWWTKSRLGWKDASALDIENSAGSMTLMHLLAAKAVRELQAPTIEAEPEEVSKASKRPPNIFEPASE